MVLRRIVLATLTAALAVFPSVRAQTPTLTPEAERFYRKQAEEWRERLSREKAETAKLPGADLGIGMMLPRAYPRPKSAWQTTERSLYRSILTKGKFDVLVVPFQVEGYALARDQRSMMTAQLAMALGDAGKKVADPYLVARALGDGQRRYELREVFDLAHEIGARTVVLGYAGRVTEQAMRVTVNVYERGERETFNIMLTRPSQFDPSAQVPSERLKSRHFENLALSAETSPISLFQRVLPDVLAFLGVEAKAPAPAKTLSRFDDTALPDSPFALAKGAATPARDAYYLQLLATLAPRPAGRERERLVEKSMLAVQRMSPESPDYRLLRARAFMHLGLRGEAIRALGKPVNPEERHLLALLNGNLPEVQAQRGKAPRGPRALMMALEENAIAVAYGSQDQGRHERTLAALQLPPGMWAYLATRRLTEWNLWMPRENLELKALLDRDLPIEGFTAAGLVRGAGIVGGAPRSHPEADLSVLNHGRRHIQKVAAQWCCTALQPRVTEADVLDLVLAIGVDNLTQRARFLTHVQGRPNEAIVFLGSVESAYQEQPDFLVAKGYAELERARTATGAEQDGLLRSAFAAGVNAWFWEQGQTDVSARALDLWAATGRRDYGGLDNVFASDYPYRPFYSFWQGGGEPQVTQSNARDALENSCFDFTPVGHLEWTMGKVENRWAEVDTLLGALGQRFVGNPDRTRLVAQASLRRGDSAGAQRVYREAIQAQPDAEKLYSELGQLLFEDGADDKAAEVLMGYPGLKKGADVNAVRLSNYAFDAGSLYYWSGDTARAIPLYKTAAELRTGSSASITSETRLAIIGGDYLAAVRGSLDRGQRYNSEYGYRDYLSLLHALGLSQQGWEGFAALLPHIDRPQIWEAALVGHRLQGASEAEIAAWAATAPVREAGAGAYPYAPTHLLRAAVVDRTPSPDLATRLTAIERPVWQIEHNPRHVVRAGRDGTWHAVLGPDSPNNSTLLPGLFEKTRKARVKSDLVYYAEAYAAIRKGNFDAARGMLDEASRLYDLRLESLGYLLPAYAYAAARSKNTAALRKSLEAFPAPLRRFDHQLAQGILAATNGNSAQATEHLRLALHRRPFTEVRPVFTEYQYAEVCEWLFEATRDPRYRDLALDWARKNQTVQPWFAWAYALEAKLATEPAARSRAIAMAYYLDRNSERLASLPKDEVSKAVKEFGGRNPFKRALEKAPKQPT